MKTTDMFKYVSSHIGYLEKLILEGDSLSNNLGNSFNMCMGHMDIFNLALFENIFLEWYRLYGEREGK